MIRWIIVGLLALAAARTARANDWPEWMGPDRDGVWRETGIVAKFPRGGPKVTWRTPVGPGYSGPSVAGGRVFVMDRKPALDAEGKPVKGDRSGTPGAERVLCLDAATGKQIWVHEYDCPYT